MTRKQRRSNKGQSQQQNITVAQAKTAIKGINRVFELTEKSGDNASLKLSGSIGELKVVIFDCAADFSKADFLSTSDLYFNETEQDVFKALGINTFERKATVSREKAFTRASAYAGAMKVLEKKPMTKEAFCILSDKLYRDKNPETDAASWQEVAEHNAKPANKNKKKQAVAEQFFRYGTAAAIACGWVEETGKGAETLYSLPK